MYSCNKSWQKNFRYQADSDRKYGHVIQIMRKHLAILTSIHVKGCPSKGSNSWEKGLLYTVTERFHGGL